MRPCICVKCQFDPQRRGPYFRTLSNEMNSLPSLRSIVRGEHIITTADIAFVLFNSRYDHLTQLTYCGKQIDLLNIRGSYRLRKGWKDKFAGLPTALYPFDLSLYDQYYMEADEYSIFADLVHCFKAWADAQGSCNTTFIVLFVNATEFREKLRSVPFSRHIESFTGENNVQETVAHILDLLTERKGRRCHIRARVCDLLDPENLAFLHVGADHAMRQKQIREQFRPG